MRTRESEGERQGGAWRLRGVEEEAGGGQGKQEVAEASRARATPRLCLLAEEDDRGGSGDGLGRAGPGKWAPGKLGRWPGGLLSLSFISSFLFLFSVVCFDLVLDTKPFYKILEIVMWVELKYTKPHKMFQ